VLTVWNANPSARFSQFLPENPPKRVGVDWLPHPPQVDSERLVDQGLVALAGRVRPLACGFAIRKLSVLLI
jgi:hypothetical protein